MVIVYEAKYLTGNSCKDEAWDKSIDKTKGKFKVTVMLVFL